VLTTASAPLRAEKKDTAGDTGGAFGRAADNPVGGWSATERATAAGSASICRRCSMRSAWPS